MTSSKIGLTDEIQLWEPWKASHIPDELFTFCLPTSFAASKNALFNCGDRKKGYTKLAQGVKRDIQQLCAEGLRNCREVEPKRKVWISMHVEMSKHNADCHNLIELYFDAIKEVIGVDDRYFSLWRLDWSIVKFDPQTYVGIAQ